MTILILFCFFFFWISAKKRIWFYKLSFCFFYFNYISRVPILVPSIHTQISHIATSIPCIATLISLICLNLFPDSPFQLLQIAIFWECDLQKVWLEWKSINKTLLKTLIGQNSMINWKNILRNCQKRDMLYKLYVNLILQKDAKHDCKNFVKAFELGKRCLNSAVKEETENKVSSIW